MYVGNFFFLSCNFLTLFHFFKGKAQFVALCTLFSERADIHPLEFLRINLQFNLQLTRRHAPASAFLQLLKVFLARSMSGHVTENTYTFMLMNTERTYVRTAYVPNLLPFCFVQQRRKRKEVEETERGKTNFNCGYLSAFFSQLLMTLAQ